MQTFLIFTASYVYLISGSMNKNKKAKNSGITILANFYDILKKNRSRKHLKVEAIVNFKHNCLFYELTA